MVYVFVADGVEELELIAPVDMLRRAGVEVALAGVTGMTVTGSHGIILRADLPAEKADMTKAEMIVLPGGGPGTKNLAASEIVREAVTKAVHNDIWIGAICAAPSILQKRGLLDGRRFTCYPGCETVSLPGTYTGAQVETDGKFITGKGAGAAAAFGHALIAALRGEAAAKEIDERICRLPEED